MLVPDCLVLDLIFKADAALDPEVLTEAMGGPEAMAARKPLDPDMQDPRFEMELSPSMPFRRRGERRLMFIDDSVAPMRADPATDPIVPIDLRPEKARLIALCETGMVRLGRLFALGSWGDAVLVAEDAKDLRGISLLGWVLDPSVDIDGKRRANRLTPEEFEEKILGYEKRLEELSESEILESIGPATLTRQNDLLVVDALSDDGTWDLRNSLAMEAGLAAVDRFSIIPGAPSAAKRAADAEAEAEAEPAETSPGAAGDDRPGLDATEVDGELLVMFPRERFDLDIAAAIGKRDWESVLLTSDLSPAQRDRVFRDGAAFVAPLEFLSEVFIDGVPVSKALFDTEAKGVGTAQVLDVHCPRFGPALLIELPPKQGEKQRFITSMTGAAGAVVELLS